MSGHWGAFGNLSVIRSRHPMLRWCSSAGHSREIFRPGHGELDSGGTNQHEDVGEELEEHRQPGGCSLSILGYQSDGRPLVDCPWDGLARKL